MQVCIYCASSAYIDPEYFEATRVLARDLVKHDVQVVYGGGAYGLMGTLADTVLEHKGKIKGIMPQFMNEVEWAHKGVTDFEFTHTMHERKARFLEGTDALITLPGGTGTMEELLEAITLKKLGQFTKPIIILNTNNYYDALRVLLERSVEERFMAERHVDMWDFVDDPLDVIPAIRRAKPWSDQAIQFAAVKEK